MNKKLIFFDIDGTLISEESTDIQKHGVYQALEYFDLI